MADKLSLWVKAFSDCELPVLYKSKYRLHKLQKDEQDITVTVLTDIARQDPGFSITLLRKAGRSKRKEITTLSHAISLISIPLVIKMLTDLPVLEKVFDKNTVVKILNVYASQYQIAFMSRGWSILRNESENNEIFTAGLNRGFVRFMLYLIDPEKAIALEKIYLSPDENHKTKEKDLLGHNVDEIAASIAKNWKLPELICESYSGKHHNPKITGIRLATELMHQIYSHSSIHYPEDLTIRIAEYIRTPIDSSKAKVNQILVNSIRHGYQYLPYQPLLKILMCYPTSIRSEVKELKKSTTQNIVPECIKLLRSKNTDKSTRGLIEVALKAMKDGIGFSRVIFMTYDANDKNLRVISDLIDNDLPTHKQLIISLELNKLFNELLKKEQVLCINSKNQHKFSNLLPDLLRPMKPNATIIVNSFFVNKKIAGCFFVDHGLSDKQLSVHELQSFKIVCRDLKAAIESKINKKILAKKVA